MSTLEPGDALIAAATGATGVRRRERLMSLWGGYGELVRLHLEGSTRETVIVKEVTPPQDPGRGGEDGRSHARKRRSYEVEAAFYRSYAPQTTDPCRVPHPLAVQPEGEGWRLLLEDLDAAGYPSRRGRESADLRACIAWLAAFHARFLGFAPEGLWPTGTYWHLATRPDELARTTDGALREAAPRLDAALSGARFQTIVHGDAKPANFCFSPGGEAVAAVDFQYAGGGAGVKDVAYLLHGSVAPHEERALLDHYFAGLRCALADRADVPVDALEREWRALYPLAAADFVRFLAGWAPGSYEQGREGRAVVARALAALR